MSVSLDLTQVLIAKFCHDLAGTMGAVNNSIDFLLEKKEDMQLKAIGLLTNSAQHAIANLRYFREAYGISNNEGETDFELINELCSAYLACSNKVTLDFRYKNTHQPEVFIGKDAGKVVLCIVSVAAATLLRAGSIKVEIEKLTSGSKIIISSIGTSLKVNELHHDILCARSSSNFISTLNVHYHYTRMLLDQMGAELTIRSYDDKVEYVIQ